MEHSSVQADMMLEVTESSTSGSSAAGRDNASLGLAGTSETNDILPPSAHFLVVPYPMRGHFIQTTTFHTLDPIGL